MKQIISTVKVLEDGMKMNMDIKDKNNVFLNNVYNHFPK